MNTLSSHRDADTGIFQRVRECNVRELRALIGVDDAGLGVEPLAEDCVGEPPDYGYRCHRPEAGVRPASVASDQERTEERGASDQHNAARAVHGREDDRAGRLVTPNRIERPLREFPDGVATYNREQVTPQHDELGAPARPTHSSRLARTRNRRRLRRTWSEQVFHPVPEALRAVSMGPLCVIDERVEE